METRTQLRQIREQRGISAAQIAKAAGVSRQTIYAIEAGDFVPNTTLALQLARVLEVRVEDLFALDAAPAPARAPIAAELMPGVAPIAKGQPVQLCRVGKHLVAVSAMPQPVLLPLADGVVAGIPRRANRADVQLFPDCSDDDRRLLIAGCDPGISLLAQHLARTERVDLVIAQSSSKQALTWLKKELVHVAGSHLRDTASGEYNLPAIRRMFPKGSVTVVTFAIWEQGLVVRAGNPKSIRDASDLARKDVTIVNREKGAGSRDLLDERLHHAGIAAENVRGYDRLVPGHLPAAFAVSSGDADCCVATRSAARAFGLSFIPLATERYDLVFRRSDARLPAIEALIDALNRSAIRRRLELLAGYDTSHTGEVRAS